MDDLIDALDEVFDESCRDMVFDECELEYKEDDFECDGDCENCGFNED